jgi:hypothetical protein
MSERNNDEEVRKTIAFNLGKRLGDYLTMNQHIEVGEFRIDEKTHNPTGRSTSPTSPASRTAPPTSLPPRSTRRWLRTSWPR